MGWAHDSSPVTSACMAAPMPGQRLQRMRVQQASMHVSECYLLLSAAAVCGRTRC